MSVDGDLILILLNRISFKHSMSYDTRTLFSVLLAFYTLNRISHMIFFYCLLNTKKKCLASPQSQNNIKLFDVLLLRYLFTNLLHTVRRSTKYRSYSLGFLIRTD